MKYLLLFPLLILLPACSTTNITKLAEQLKNDPATVDIQVQTIYGSLIFHRQFPTNWVAHVK